MDFGRLQEAALGFFFPDRSTQPVSDPSKQSGCDFRSQAVGSAIVHENSDAYSWNDQLWGLFGFLARTGLVDKHNSVPAESETKEAQQQSSASAGNTWSSGLWSWLITPTQNGTDPHQAEHHHNQHSTSTNAAQMGSTASTQQTGTSFAAFAFWDWFTPDTFAPSSLQSTQKPGISMDDIRAHRAKSQKLSQDRVVADVVATPMQKKKANMATSRDAENFVDWSIERSQLIGAQGEEAVRLGKVRLLDTSIVTSLKDAIDKLNRGVIECPEGFCVVTPIVFSKRKTKPHYVVYKQDYGDLAFQTLGLEDFTKPKEAAISGAIENEAAKRAAAEAAELTEKWIADTKAATEKAAAEKVIAEKKAAAEKATAERLAAEKAAAIRRAAFEKATKFEKAILKLIADEEAEARQRSTREKLLADHAVARWKAEDVAGTFTT
jgi:hypothetical protein